MRARAIRVRLLLSSAILILTSPPETLHAESPRNNAINTGHALLSRELFHCQKEIADAGAALVVAELAAMQKCRNQELMGKACDSGQLDAAINGAEKSARKRIEKACADVDLNAVGFPGRCRGPLIDSSDLVTCIVETHQEGVRRMIGAEYGSRVDPLSREALTCQKAIADAGAEIVGAELAAIQNCRNEELIGKGCDLGKLESAIAKVETRVRRSIEKNCTTNLVMELDSCGTNSLSAQLCTLEAHRIRVEEFIAIEYPSGARCEGRDGEPCDDRRFCTVGDKCLQGFCLPTGLRDCSELAGQCNGARCNETLRRCEKFALESLEPIPCELAPDTFGSCVVGACRGICPAF